MKQKNGLWATAFLLAGVLTSGCSDDNQYGGASAEPGSPVLFSVASGGSDTRTIYESNLQINWVKGDSIGICSPSDNVLPSVEGEPKHATYKVTALDADGHPHHAEIEASVQGTYLKWGNDLNTSAVFYGAYPADRIDSYPTSEDGLFKMKYITNQVCTVTSFDNGEYRTEPDMKNAYMIAKNKLQPIGDHVLLSFDPIMTTPDITITAGSYEVGTGIIQPVTVTGVSILMPKALTGKTLNYKITEVTNGAIKNPRGELLDYTTGEEWEWESVFVQIDNGGKRYVDLYEGESINLMAFLPPIPDLTGAKIRVHTLGATDFVKTINNPLQPQSKIKIQLPDITPETIKPNNWISKLDGSTLLKEMSIPAYVCKGNETSGDIEELLKKGVRAFDAEEFAFIDGVTKKINTKFVTVINNFLENKENSNEFVIVWVDNTAHVGGIQNPNKDKWISFPNNIKDAKGKVVFLEKHGISGEMTNININTIKGLFGYASKNNAIDFFLSDNNWQAQIIDTDQDGNPIVENNTAIYNQIVKYKEQSGCTGIVTIPGAEKSFDSSYGDLLLQAVIDCNFKLRRNSKSNQQ